MTLAQGQGHSAHIAWDIIKLLTATLDLDNISHNSYVNSQGCVMTLNPDHEV